MSALSSLITEHSILAGGDGRPDEGAAEAANDQAAETFVPHVGHAVARAPRDDTIALPHAREHTPLFDSPSAGTVELPEDFFATTWAALKGFVHAVHALQPASHSYEQLYGVRALLCGCVASCDGW